MRMARQSSFGPQASVRKLRSRVGPELDSRFGPDSVPNLVPVHSRGSSNAGCADGANAGKTGLISLRLAEKRLYSAPSHTETWLKRPSGGSRAIKARLLTRFRRNQPEN